jgi:GTP:adenosylcobinamide-phosphate guanylyltransferase
MATNPFTALILAADRHAHDPVAEAAGVPCKALANLQGTPMLLRVIAALENNHEIGPIILSGPTLEIVEQTQVLHDMVTSGRIGWNPPRNSPSKSVEAALESIGDQAPVLITTADHAFLENHIVADFGRLARESDYDAVVALVSFEQFKNAYPDLNKTVLKFSDGAYCGCNLFAFLTAQGRYAATFWQQVEKQRKKPVRVISVIGWLAVIRYLLGRLSLTDALRVLSERMGIRVGAIVLPYPEAAVDIDSAEDWFCIQDLLSQAGEK